MGSELVSGLLLNKRSNPQKVAPPLSYTEQFYSHLPFYLSIGMTFNQYWNEDSCLVKYYRKAYEYQRKQMNEFAWLQGMYIYEALCDTAPIMNGFAKKGTKPHPYPAKPYAVTASDISKQCKEKEQNRYKRGKEIMTAFSVAFNENFKNAKQGGEEK